MRGETRRDGHRRDTVLPYQAPDGIRSAVQRRLDRCTQNISGNVSRRRNQRIEVLFGHALQDDLLVGKPVLEDGRQIERYAAVDLLQRRLSVDKACLRTDIPIELGFADQILQRLDVRIAALLQVSVQHVFGQAIVRGRADVPDRGTGWDERRIEIHLHKLRNAVRQWFSVGIDGKTIRVLFEEYQVAIERQIFVNAALKQRSARSWIDDRGSQTAQIADGTLRDVDGFNIGVVEQFLVHMLADDAYPHS